MVVNASSCTEPMSSNGQAPASYEDYSSHQKCTGELVEKTGILRLLKETERERETEDDDGRVR